MFEFMRNRHPLVMMGGRPESAGSVMDRPSLSSLNSIFKTIPDDLTPARPTGVKSLLAYGLRQMYGFSQMVLAPREALDLCTARKGTALARHVSGVGRIRALASQPFVCAEWSSAMRMRRMIEHCAIIDKLGHPFGICGKQYVEILSFKLEDEPCRLTLDQPTWLDSDGPLCISLWVGFDRVFSISFCLSDGATGRTAYVGGIQGRRSEQALDQNRALTKAAHGTRPRDLIFEFFRMLLPHLGVTQMKGVADGSRYQLTKRAMLTVGTNDKALSDYDEIWESRGGVLGQDGFFVIPVAISRRDISDIPAKKRGMYKKRYALLDQIQADIASALQSGTTVQLHRF